MHCQRVYPVQDKSSYWYMFGTDGEIPRHQHMLPPNPEIVNDSLALQQAIKLLNSNSIDLAGTALPLSCCTHTL